MKSNLQPIAILVFLLFFVNSHLHSQYYFSSLTEEDGLSDNRVTCFLKDKTGFIWVGTKNGLNRYDGHSFKIFKPSPGNSISNEVINSIVQDSSGKIWVGTLDGLNRYDPVTDVWETIRPKNISTKDDLPSYFIWDLSVDEQNRIWIVSDVWEFSMYDQQTKKFTYYDWPSANRQKQFDDLSFYRSIQKIERKNENEWWLGTTIGLFSVQIKTGKFIFYGAGYDEGIIDLKYDRKHGNIFTVTETGKLFCYNEQKNMYREIKTSTEPYPPVTWKPGTTEAILLSHPSGLLQVNPLTAEAIIITHHSSVISSLLPGGINDIYPDKAGIVWVATNNGINYYNNYNSTAHFIPLQLVSDKKSVDDMSAAFYDSIDKKYYVTSINPGKVFVLDEVSGNISSVSEINGKPLGACTNICTDRQHNIWLLTADNVYRYSRLQRRFILFPTPNKNREVVFHDMVEDKNGDYWFATWLDAVYRYVSADHQFYRFTTNNNINCKSITSLINDPAEDAVWLGSSGFGLYRYDIKKNTVKVFDEKMGDPEYEQLNLIRDAASDRNGNTWFATYGSGLYVYRQGRSDKISFDHITIKNGLTHSTYYAIVSGKKNRLWLLSSKGLSAMNDSGKFLYEVLQQPGINFSNYAPDPRYPKRIFYNTIKDELLVPVAGGLLLYYPDKVNQTSAFSIALTDISIAGRSVMYDSTYFDKTKRKIPYQLNSLAFNFAALNFSKASSMSYEYKLHDTDPEWKSLQHANTVNFPDLPPGPYSFMIRAKDADGNLSSNTVSYSFYIRLPFWQTWWFYLLLIIMISSLVYVLYKYQLNKKLEVERFRLSISRDLHDDIGSTISSINILSKVALQQQYKEESIMAASMQKIKDRSAAIMENMGDMVWAINPQNDSVAQTIFRMKEFAAEILEPLNISYHFEEQGDFSSLKLDVKKRKDFYLLYKEAINNAAKYSKCNNLQIEVKQDQHSVRLIITDDGIGFNGQEIKAGNGLANMRERAAAMAADFTIHSSEGSGTKILLTIPIT